MVDLKRNGFSQGGVRLSRLAGFLGDEIISLERQRKHQKSKEPSNNDRESSRRSSCHKVLPSYVYPS